MKITICQKCGAHVATDRYLEHLSKVHSLDVMSFMHMAKTWRGLTWSGLILTIGLILGILLRGVIA